MSDTVRNMAALLALVGDDRIAEEQAALRRVATLVARGAPTDAVFAAVTEEAGLLLGVHHATMSRYDPHGTAEVVASWSRTGDAFPVGTCLALGGWNAHTLVFQTHRPARISDYAEASGPTGKAARDFGFRASVSVPVIVEDRLWGVMIVEHTREEPLPPDTEARLAGFTELAGTAIANAQARLELRGFAGEQAALRRVATLVAGAAQPGDVFAAVTEEAVRLLGADFATMSKYGPDGSITVVAAWGSARAAFPVGSRWSLGGQNLHTAVFRTRAPARIDDNLAFSGPIAEAARELGMRSGVGVPVSAEGRLWGVLIVGSRAQPPPAGAEARLAGFTELAATAIANAEAQAALAASRARMVATADATRRRIERNLHDGAQQRLVSLALVLRAAEATAPPGVGEPLLQQLDAVAAGLDDVLEELREIAHGLHPAILADGGLQPALKTLARRSSIPVDLDIQVDRRLPDPVEIAAYYMVCEALANAAKHAHATTADVQVTERDAVLHVRVCDNGRGGAGFSNGSGLVGLKDRAEALGGHLALDSPPGAGTTLEIELPLEPAESKLPPEPDW